MCAYKDLKWYIIRLTVGRHYMLSNGKYVKSIQIYTAHPLPNFIAGHPPGASKFHGAQPLGQHPRVSCGPSPMTLRFTAVDDQVALCFAQWRPLLKRRKGNGKYMYIIYIIRYYIYYVFERYPGRHAKKWRRPGCGPLFWFEFAQAFSILWCSDWSDSRKTSWWLPMVQWYHDISQKGQVLVQQQRVGAGTAQRGTNLHGPCLRKTIFLPFFIYLFFVWAKHIRCGAPHRVLNWFLSMCRYSAPCFLLDPLNSRYERYTTLKSFNFKWLPQMLQETSTISLKSIVLYMHIIYIYRMCEITRQPVVNLLQLLLYAPFVCWHTIGSRPCWTEMLHICTLAQLMLWEGVGS